MSWHLRFWRRVRVLPGVTVNLSKSGPSLSLGPRGSKVTIGRNGLRQTIGLPGTGLFGTNYRPWKTSAEKVQAVEGRVNPEASAREAGPAEPAAELEGLRVAADSRTQCEFCGAQAIRGQRCPMCNQPV